jgi:hypothetical protein
MKTLDELIDRAEKNIEKYGKQTRHAARVQREKNEQYLITLEGWKQSGRLPAFCTREINEIASYYGVPPSSLVQDSGAAMNRPDVVVAGSSSFKSF